MVRKYVLRLKPFPWRYIYRNDISGIEYVKICRQYNYFPNHTYRFLSSRDFDGKSPGTKSISSVITHVIYTIWQYLAAFTCPAFVMATGGMVTANDARFLDFFFSVTSGIAFFSLFKHFFTTKQCFIFDIQFLSKLLDNGIKRPTRWT